MATIEVEIGPSDGLVVEARLGRHTVRTDQPVDDGGGDTAASPFDLLFASLGTCAGYYAAAFCRARKIDTEGLALRLTAEREGDHGRVTSVRIEIRPPPGFPDKYRRAIVRAVDGCTVKKLILDPPQFSIEAV